jgi:hypothetical protein
MTRSKFEIEALDANLWNEDEFELPAGVEELGSEAEFVDAWWQDDK